MTYFAYLDEFGHIGPYVSRQDPRHNDSPVFGLAGFILPSEQVRGFGTWFFQRKCELLAFEIDRGGKHPAQWEKKGSSLYTVTNVTRYDAVTLALADEMSADEEQYLRDLAERMGLPTETVEAVFIWVGDYEALLDRLDALISA